MSAPVDPLERLITNLLQMQRAGTTITADGKRALDELFLGIQADLQRLDPTGVASRYRALRRDRFFRALQNRTRDWLPEYDRVLRDGLAELGRAQGLHAVDTLVFSMGVPKNRLEKTPITQARVRSILNSEPFQGRVLRGHVKKIGVNVVDQVQVQVRIGMTNEEALPAIFKRMRGVLVRSKRETEAIVRTAVTHITGEAHLDSFRANADVVKGVRFSAALDDRTTESCLALDGTVWPVDSPDIVQPGYHWGCRSVLVPEIDWEAAGVDPPKEGERFVRDLRGVSPADLNRRVSARRRTGDLGKRAFIPADMTAAQWLKTQPSAVQNRVLGKGKADLFRAGEVTLKDLIRRDQTVRPLSEVLKRIAG